MRLKNFQNGLQIAPQLLRQLFGLDALTRHTTPTGPIPFHTFERISFFVQHAFDFQHRFDIFAHIESLIATTFLRLQKWELGLPEPEDIGGKLRHLTHFADFVENFAAEPGFIPHGPVLVAGVVPGVKLLRIDVFLEYLTRTKGHDAARRDADFFTGPWIPALPGALASHDKVPKTGDLDGISLL
jgi:hypothetical protein